MYSALFLFNTETKYGIININGFISHIQKLIYFVMKTSLCDSSMQLFYVPNSVWPVT